MSDREVVDREAPKQVPPYAVVVVQTPLQRRITSPTALPPDTEESDYLTRSFHYRVPERIKTEIRAGQLVWVPFGGRYLQGVIVGFDDQCPVDDTREIDQIADPLPVLSPIHIELAHWLSRHYLAPIHRVIQTMSPPGVIQGVDVIVCPVPDCQITEATEGQEQILSLLRQKGPLSLRQISRLTKVPNWRSVVGQLVEHGWATRRREIRPPRAKPKLVPVVRARGDVGRSDYPSRQAHKQRRALAYLLWHRRHRAADDWLPLSEAAAKAGVSPAVVRALIKKGLVELTHRQVWRDPFQGKKFVPSTPPRLTPEQREVWRIIEEDLESPGARPFLLQGVTGSGKTEIYLRAAQRVLERGKGAIVLVPEIALTPQTIRRFGARFPTVLAVMHSRLSLGERFDQWRRLRNGELRLVVGSRSAIFAPVSNLGLVVLDEEHESSYKQEQTPRYHAREVAVRLAELAGATCILGSATPALESAYRAERGAYQLLTLPQRVMGHRRMLEQQADQLHRVQRHYHPVEHDLPEALYAELPPVEIVDMRAELRAGNRGILSRSLKKGIEAALAAGEQIILFLNRRGSATFVMCRDCGHVLKCPRCEVPLTYHSDAQRLVCHHCSRKTLAPSQCPNCRSNRIKYFGIGTQRVEQVVHQAYPNARIVRWDLDTTGSRRAHERILDRFIRGEADVMIGTQMIAKGLDLPKVTLVGVITADTLINLPDIRSSERTFQLLTQVAGRAGRSILGGRVVIQTYTPRHPAIQAASKHDYWAFYQQEMAFRRKHWYPPISRLIRLLYVHASADKAQREAQELHQILTLKIARLGLPEIDLIGPAPSFFSRLRGKSRWQIVIRGTDPRVLLKDLRLPLGWRVDVDPVTLL